MPPAYYSALLTRVAVTAESAGPLTRVGFLQAFRTLACDAELLDLIMILAPSSPQKSKITTLFAGSLAHFRQFLRSFAQVARCARNCSVRSRPPRQFGFGSAGAATRQFPRRTPPVYAPGLRRRTTDASGCHCRERRPFNQGRLLVSLSNRRTQIRLNAHDARPPSSQEAQTLSSRSRNGLACLRKFCTGGAMARKCSERSHPPQLGFGSAGTDSRGNV